MYPSNLYKQAPTRSESDPYLNVLIGNSADPSNNHLKVFDSLKPLMHEGVRFIALFRTAIASMPHRSQARENIFFGEKFIALLDFIPIEKYLELLGKIDIAIFAHERQQAMGNTITLLGYGKKVFIRSDVTPWQLFTSLGVCIFDTNRIEISREKISNLSNNTKIISEYFSTANLVKQYNDLF